MSITTIEKGLWAGALALLVGLALAAGAILASPAASAQAKAYAQEPAYAMVYDDDTIVFQRGNKVDPSHGALVQSFANIESASALPKADIYGTEGIWGLSTTLITKAVFKDPIAPQSLRAWFANMWELKTIQGMQNLDTSKATTMEFMFYDCRKLTSIDLSRFNTANVTNMAYMFCGCSSVTTLDCSRFNTARVTDMSLMFCDDYKLRSVNVKSFNTAKVKDFTCMFTGTSKLTTLDLSSFSVAKKARASLFHSNYQCKTNLKTLTVSSAFKAKLALSFELNKVTHKKNNPMLYVKSAKATSSNKKVATITKKGDATVKGAGKTKLKGSARSLTLKVVPPATTITSLKSAENGFTVSWKKQGSAWAAGYEVKYSTDPSMKGATTKTVKGAKKSSLKVAKLTSGATYYVQVRVYKKSGTTVRSNWSPVKAITVA